jgi:prevent-host-death family protein
MKQIITIMHTLTVRDLRYDFAKVEAYLADGEDIEITKHGRPVARISPPRPATVPKFDAEAHRRRMKETWGDRVFTDEEVKEMREYEHGEYR